MTAYFPVVTYSGMILRRLGPPTDAARCSGGHGCPEILELDSGDFAVIGTDITAQAVGELPTGSGCGPGERVVCVPRQTVVQVRPYLPAAV